MQKRALELEQDIKQLKDGIASYKKSTVKSIDENARLTDKLDNYQKADSKLNDYLQKHYIIREHYLIWTTTLQVQIFAI